MRPPFLKQQNSQKQGQEFLALFGLGSHASLYLTTMLHLVWRMQKGTNSGDEWCLSFKADLLDSIFKF